MTENNIIPKSKVIIVISEKDVAGRNMLNRLMDLIEFEKIENFNPPANWPKGKYVLHQADICLLLEIPNNQIKTDYLKNSLDADLLIYASKHSSAMGKKALLVHTTGIWGKESGHGGKDHEIAFAPALALTLGFNKILELKNENKMDHYWIGAEVTHHGPSSLEIPIMYIETGGTEDEWNDKDACNLIADVIKFVVEKYNLPHSELEKLETIPAMIGIGGGHYAPSFIKKLEKQEYLLGHIIPKYAHEYIDENMIKQAWDKTIAKSKIFVIDKKGTKSQYRHNFIKIIEDLNFPWVYSR